MHSTPQADVSLFKAVDMCVSEVLLQNYTGAIAVTNAGLCCFCATEWSWKAFFWSWAVLLCFIVEHLQTSATGSTAAPTLALTRIAVDLWWLMAQLYEEHISVGAIAVTQACCEHVLSTTTEQWGMQFAQTSGSVLFCWESPLSSSALQNRLSAGLCHCSCTYGDLLFIQVCSDATPKHCSTGQGKIAFSLFFAALQNRLTA